MALLMAPLSLASDVLLGVYYRLFAVPNWLASLAKQILMPRIKGKNTATELQTRLSLVGNNRHPNQIRSLIPIFGKPGVVWLAGGFPHPELFPIKEISFTTVSGHKVDFTKEQIAKSQQYMLDNGGLGYIPLLNWVTGHMKKYHNPPYEGWKSTITAGNSDAPMRILDLMLDPGDSILVEEYAFVHSFAQMRPWVDAKGVHCEDILYTPNGPDIAHMKHTLANWSLLRPGKKFPKMLFIITIGQNPTAITLKAEQMQEIYDICSFYDIIILEDDPYRLLYFGDIEKPDDAPVPGLDGIPPSFLSVDVDARVIRMDSFSKFTGPGFRLGWLTGPEKLMLKLFDPNLTCSVSQVILGSMLEAWGEEGVRNHVEMMQRKYRRRARTLCHAAKKHLGDSVSFAPPTAGMFIWMNLKIPDTKFLQDKLAAAGVAIVPGGMFTLNLQKSQSSFARVSFCQATEEDLDLGCKKIKNLIF